MEIDVEQLDSERPFDLQRRSLMNENRNGDFSTLLRNA